jgi:putative transport protein
MIRPMGRPASTREARADSLPGMIEYLVEQPLLLLFAVLAVGFAAGRVRAWGVSLGVAAVLFAGLAAGALDPRLQLPEIVQRFGLVLFVYTVGVASGPGFFASFRRRGLRDAAYSGALLALAAGLTVLARHAARLNGARAAGLFTGSLTNTPALAAVLERVRAVPGATERLLADPVVAYSLCYPMGVLGVIVVMAIARAHWAGALRASRRQVALEVRSVRVLEPAACALPVAELVRRRGWRVLFARRRRADQVDIIRPDEPLAVGDLVTLVAEHDDLARVVDEIGEPAEEQLELDRSDLDFRRVFVSEPALFGRTLSDLQLLDRFGAIVTRVRRGDVDVLPDGRTVLEPGDRVRVLAPRARMKEVVAFFGDSYRALAEVDVLSFGLGCAAGLALGLVPMPLPGGGTFQLGMAGGPLIAGLVLGALGRSGPLVWQLPFSAGLTLRQIGLVLFLAGVGTRSGWVFAQTFGEPGALPLFVAGALVTMATTTAALVVARRVLKVRPDVALGMVAAVHTQPAALAFATESAGDDGPNAGWASVFPFATIAKILLAQLLVSLLK